MPASIGEKSERVAIDKRALSAASDLLHALPTARAQPTLSSSHPRHCCDGLPRLERDDAVLPREHRVLSKMREAAAEHKRLATLLLRHRALTQVHYERVRRHASVLEGWIVHMASPDREAEGGSRVCSMKLACSVVSHTATRCGGAAGAG